MELQMMGPELLLPSLPASSTRQLVRRRSVRAAESPRGQRCRSTNTANAPAPAPAPATATATFHKTPAASTGKRSRLLPPSSGNIAAVRPGSNATQGRQDGRNPREPAVKPPRQVLSARLLAHNNPYQDDKSPKEQRSVTQRSAVKTRNQQHPTLATSRAALGGRYTVPPAPPTLRNAAPKLPRIQMRPYLRSVRAKVDSHLCPLIPRNQQPAQGPCQSSTKNKSLAESHQQLELLLSRIERVTNYHPPPPPAAQFKRTGAGAKVAKGVSRQMAQPPPVPAGTPMLSARRNNTNAMRTDGGGGAELEEDHDRYGDGDDIAIPFVQNPQRLPLAQRDALMKLLQRSEQHDKGIVDMVGATGDSSRDAMLMLLQMIPLSLNDSPYKDKLLKEQPHLKEPQKQQQQLRPGDDGQVFSFRTLEEKLQGAKKMRDYMEAEQKVHATGQYHSGRNALENRADEHPLTERQEQAMRERAQLERDKQLVINCRERHLLKEQLWEQGAQPPSRNNNSQSKNPTTDTPTDPWKQVLQERDRFQANCNRSCFYNNSQSSAPWKIYAKVASKLSSQLIESVDAEFHRSLANYIKEILGHKVN